MERCWIEAVGFENGSPSNDLYAITNSLHVSRCTILYLIVLNCISSEPQYYRTVRCTIKNRLLVRALRPAEIGTGSLISITNTSRASEILSWHLLVWRTRKNNSVLIRLSERLSPLLSIDFYCTIISIANEEGTNVFKSRLNERLSHTCIKI